MTRRTSRDQSNKLSSEDKGAHDWYRFVLSFPPHLVRECLQRFNVDSSCQVLDPFCGTGTTVVECKKLGIPSIGIEANSFACFASRVKTDWSVTAPQLLRHAAKVADYALLQLEEDGLSDEPVQSAAVSNLRSLPPEQLKLLLANSISPLPLHKTLVLRHAIEAHANSRSSNHEKLALAKALVTTVGNLHFGPEVGVGRPKPDAAVISTWLAYTRCMAADLRELVRRKSTPCVVHHADSRDLQQLESRSIGAVITSPPYPNEKDYTRTTRLESVVLGFISTKEELRLLKQGLVRSNTRNVYKDDQDDKLVQGHRKIQDIAAAIEARRIELGKTSGFERLYAKVTKLYFGGIARHLAELRRVLRPGARLAYVVGDQASYLRIMIRTGELLAEIADTLGYQVESIDLFRTRLATATREQLREEVVVLRWRG